MKNADWKARLDGYLLARKDVPFKWGTNDCFFFVADAVEVMSGIDLIHNLRDQYSDKRGAVLKMRIKRSFEEYMTRIFDEVLVRKERVENFKCTVGAEMIGPKAEKIQKVTFQGRSRVDLDSATTGLDTAQRGKRTACRTHEAAVLRGRGR